MLLSIKNIKLLEENPTDENGSEKFKPLIDELKVKYKKVIEIGGGKNPMYLPSSDYTVNDISPYELEFIKKKNYKTALFDICGKIPDIYNEKFDLVFSKFVLEHVPDGKKYYENIKKILKKDGVCVTFHPTLYCLPFVINYLLPQKISEIVYSLFIGKAKKKVNNKIIIVKFPAKYEYCFSTDNHMSKIKKIGFGKVKIISLYGHPYYKKMPLIKQFHRKITEIIKIKNIKLLSSYAYTVVQK